MIDASDNIKVHILIPRSAKANRKIPLKINEFTRRILV